MFRQEPLRISVGINLSVEADGSRTSQSGLSILEGPSPRSFRPRVTSNFLPTPQGYPRSSLTIVKGHWRITKQSATAEVFLTSVRYPTRVAKRAVQCFVYCHVYLCSNCGTYLHAGELHFLICFSWIIEWLLLPLFCNSICFIQYLVARTLTALLSIPFYVCTRY